MRWRARINITHQFLPAKHSTTARLITSALKSLVHPKFLQAMAELRALEVERKGAWRSYGGSSRTCTGPNNAWTSGVQNRQRRGWIEGDSSSGDSGEDELSSRIGALTRRPLSSLPNNISPFASQQHNSNSTRIRGSKIDLAVIMPRSRLLERAIAGSMHTRPAIAQSPDKGRRVDASATAYNGSSSPSSPGRRQNTRTMPTSSSPAGKMGGPRRRQQQERGREARVLADHVAKLQAKISELERRHLERQWAPARARVNTRDRRAVRQQQQVVVEDDMVVLDDDDGEEGGLEDMVEALRNAADRALVLAAQAEGSAQKWKAR
jgi:hypothetical protein